MNTIENQSILDTFFQSFVKEKKPLLLIDYDGTIAPFCENPRDAYPYPTVLEKLKYITQRKKSHLIIVSGRKVNEILELYGSDLEIWGCHGFENRKADGSYTTHPLTNEMKEGLKIAYHELLLSPFAHKMEWKTFSIALHWRGCKEEAKKKMKCAFLDRWQTLAEKFQLEVVLFDGGIELRPKGKNKGDVVQELLTSYCNEGPTAYLGDDLTDEDAFAALGKRGLSVLVRDKPRQTLANIHLEPPEGLSLFLDRWIQAEDIL